MSISVLIPAAGASSRMNAADRKPFLSLAGETLLERTCRCLKQQTDVTELILAVHTDDLERVHGEYWERLQEAGATMAVAGGENRAESVWNALMVCNPSADLVAVHDAARPFVSAALWERLVVAAERDGAAVPVLTVTDTIKRGEADSIQETVSRVGLYRAQTPQVFWRDLLVEANEFVLSTGGFSDRITDDASLLEAYGKPVKMVLGETFNMKITTPDDLRLAELYVQEKLV